MTVTFDAPGRPEIVCLCGSTRFKDAFNRAEYDLEQAGIIALSVGFDPDSAVHGGTVGITPEKKALIDRLHHRKIDLADRVLVLNVDGYVGGSTRSEIAYALAHGVRVDYLVPVTVQA